MVDERPRSQNRKLVVAGMFVIFIAVLAATAWVVVLNPDSIASRLPEKGQQTVSPR